MSFRLLLFFVLICFRFTTAQNFSRDSLEIIIVSLEKENPSKNRDSLLAIYYNDMCEKCIYSGDERADRFLKRFEESYKKIWIIYFFKNIIVSFLIKFLFRSKFLGKITTSKMYRYDCMLII
jgi:hypothetical protein